MTRRNVSYAAPGDHSRGRLCHTANHSRGRLGYTANHSRGRLGYMPNHSRGRLCHTANHSRGRLGYTPNHSRGRLCHTGGRNRDEAETEGRNRRQKPGRVRFWPSDHCRGWGRSIGDRSLTVAALIGARATGDVRPNSRRSIAPAARGTQDAEQRGGGEDDDRERAQGGVKPVRLDRLAHRGETDQHPEVAGAHDQ